VQFKRVLMFCLGDWVLGLLGLLWLRHWVMS